MSNILTVPQTYLSEQAILNLDDLGSVAANLADYARQGLPLENARVQELLQALRQLSNVALVVAK
jgi:hypothetical protein